MRKSKEEIISELGESFNSLCGVCKSVSDEDFNISKENKWTPAENIQHLVTATRMTRTAFVVPKFVHVLLYGKPGRTSHGFSKVVSNYQNKLEHGAQATGVYVPKKADYSKAVLHDKLNTEAQKLIAAIDKNWTDEQLDKYVIKHPILDLLTLRELAYFTIYHNGHHHETISRYYL
jgi:hypothetical protein